MSSPLQVMFGPGVSNQLIMLGQLVSNLKIISDPSPPQIAYDSFEEYADGYSLSGLNSFSPWVNNTGSLVVYFLGPYVDRVGPFGIQSYDSLENYSDGVAVNGLNNGTNWGGSYVDRPRAFGNVAGDDMESYSDGAALNGLNSGSSYNSFAGWQGSYVNHDN